MRTGSWTGGCPTRRSTPRSTTWSGRWAPASTAAGCTRRSRCGRQGRRGTATPGEVSALAGYSGTPLPVKLGIKPGGRVLLDSPAGGPALGVLPDGVVLHRRQGSGSYDVVLLVAPSGARLHARWPRLVPALSTAG